MMLRPGTRPYEDPDHVTRVKVKATGQIGEVARVAPSGNHIPAQAYAVFNWKHHDEGWIPLRDLVRVSMALPSNKTALPVDF